MTAVILDPQAVSRGLLNSVLTNGGHQVVGDMNISPANLTRAVNLKPQIVCVDIGQADGEGLALLDEIRGALPKTLIFIVSNSLDSGMVEAALQHGAHGFIVKPFNSVTVLQTIRNTVLKVARR